MIIVEEVPQTMAAPGFPPPRPPQRTAVGTDDEEKRPCKWCGHTKAEHLGPACRAERGNSITMSVRGQTFTPGRLVCGCPRYRPKDE